MKHSLLLIAFFLSGSYVFAQNQTGASSQAVTLNMQELVNASFTPSGSGGTGGGSSVGSLVQFALNGANALMNGIESQVIGVTLMSLSDYDVSVSASSNAFAYTGSSTTNTLMLVKDVLSFKVTGNNTGGTISNGFSQYKAIDGTNSKLLISSGGLGVSTFSFQYKAQPGFNYAAGTYTTDIVFTVVKK